MILHECTAGFAQHVFTKWLPRYVLLRPKLNDREMLLSPHQFGWPVYRPRLYTALVNLDTIEVVDGQIGFDRAMQRLFRKCSVDVASLYVAPQACLPMPSCLCMSTLRKSLSVGLSRFLQEEVQAAKQQASRKLCRPLSSRFDELLGGQGNAQCTANAVGAVEGNDS